LYFTNKSGKYFDNNMQSVLQDIRTNYVIYFLRHKTKTSHYIFSRMLKYSLTASYRYFKIITYRPKALPYTIFTTRIKVWTV